MVLGELEVPVQLWLSAVRFASEREWQLARARHASCSVKLEWVNSSYFSGKWERFLCGQGEVPESTVRLQIASGKLCGYKYNTHSFL